LRPSPAKVLEDRAPERRYALKGGESSELKSAYPTKKIGRGMNGLGKIVGTSARRGIEGDTLLKWEHEGGD
jgi:hypothetical protein